MHYHLPLSILCVSVLFILAGCVETSTDERTGAAATEEQHQPTAEPEQTVTPTSEPATTPVPAETPAPTLTPDPTPVPELTPTPEPTPAPEPTPEATPELADAEWLERGRLTILLAGSDEAADRAGARTDAMIVATLDLETGQVALLGVPRNYADFPLPDEVASIMGTHIYTGMLKRLYDEAQAFPELAPDGTDPGMVALKRTVSKMLDLHIDYYAMVNMQGFVQLVDTFGGVEIDVQERVQVRLLSPVEGEGWEQFDIRPGAQTLTGKEALAFARSRTGTRDYDRMERQRCLIRAVSDQADLQTLVTTFPDLVDVIRDNVVTDVPLEMLPEMVMLRDVADTSQIISLGFNPPNYLAGESSQGYNLPATRAIQQTVRDVIEHPERFHNGASTDDRHC